MFKLYKKDGSEVLFETEEGMEKTLKAFPDKYSLKKPEKEIIKTDESLISEIETLKSKIEELEKPNEEETTEKEKEIKIVELIPETVIKETDIIDED